MAYHKPITNVSTTGLQVRLRRQRKSSRPKMTRDGGWYNFNLPNPRPDGAPPTQSWVTYVYPLERKGRRDRAETKRKERRRALRRQAREALAEQQDE